MHNTEPVKHTGETPGNTPSYDVVIAGAGASGLFCAFTAAQGGKKVLVIEKNEKPGKKILISGGGRCNFTNRSAGPENFISRNPHFTRSALSRYTPSDFIALVERHGIEWYEKHRGQLFCKNKASDILNMLLKECASAGVTIECSSGITAVHSTGNGFIIERVQDTIQCGAFVLATGGVSIPQMGATDFAFRIAEQFGVEVHPLYPALVGLHPSLQVRALTEGLAGISLPVALRCGKTVFEEDLLFTHKGFSGPAILQISNYAAPGSTIEIDFLPGNNFTDLYAAARKHSPGMELYSLLTSVFPKRFVQVFFGNSPLNNTLAHTPKSVITDLHTAIHYFRFTPEGTDGFERAEVTGGGISTDEISSKTFELRKVPRMFVIGEALDVTGWLGGYNFQWAWSSGYCCGTALAAFEP